MLCRVKAAEGFCARLETWPGQLSALVELPQGRAKAKMGRVAVLLRWLLFFFCGEPLPVPKFSFKFQRPLCAACSCRSILSPPCLVFAVVAPLPAEGPVVSHSPKAASASPRAAAELAAHLRLLSAGWEALLLGFLELPVAHVKP